jgi:tetratricopeptide (TPR) repeat protein
MPKLPRGLVQAVARASKHIDGKYCWGLPHYSLDSKLRFQLVELGDMELFEDNDVDVELPANAGFIPFAVLRNESQFLAISTRPPYAVGMWEHEDGTVHRVWASIDDFVGRVIDKHDKTPFELFAKTLDKVSSLIDGDAYGDALGILEPALAALPRVEHQSIADELARAHNLLGLAFKGVGRYPDARRAFDKAAELGDTYCELNIIDLLLDELADPRGAIEHALAVRDKRSLDEYGRVWLARYLAHGYLDLGEPAKAEAELRQLLADHEVSAPDKIRDARTGLEEYIAKGRAGSEAARVFLPWFHEKVYEVTADDARRNRGWWDGLPDGVRDKLLEEIGREGAEVNDADIARAQDIESLYLDEDVPIEDVQVFLPLRRVATLSFHTESEDVTPLRALPALTSLRINDRVVKDFRVPSRADRALWAAAEEGDREAIEAALEAGAALATRDDMGQTALELAAGTHDVELCTWLIERGADPWAGSYLDSNEGIFGYFSDEERPIFEAAAAKAGLRHIRDEPWRIVRASREPRGASFGELAADMTVQMAPPKRDNRLCDVHAVGDDLLVGERVAQELRPLAGIELLPVTVLDHAKQPCGERYYVVKPTTIDCLNIERCLPQWNLIDDSRFDEIAAIVIDATRVGDVQVFRCAGYTEHVFVSRDVADRLTALGATGLAIDYIKR